MQNSDPNGVPADGTAAMQDSDTNDTPADETEKQGGMSWSERRAARKARKKAEKEARAAAENEELAGAGAVAAGVAGAAVVGSMAFGSESGTEPAPGTPDYFEALPESDLADDLKIEEALAEFGIAPAKEEREITADFGSFSDETVKVPEKPELTGVQDVPYDRSAAESLPGNERYPLDAGSGLADLADKMEANRGGSDYYMEDIPYSANRGMEDIPYSSNPDIADVPKEDITPAAPPAGPSAAESAAGQRFVPASRPTYEEIMDETRGASGQPSVRKDDKSGVSVVDMSDLL
jgi:hypothetical protein